MPMLSNLSSLFLKGFENTVTAIVLEAGFMTSGYDDREEYIDALLTEEEDTWEEEYKEWRDDYYAETSDYLEYTKYT